MVDVVDRTHLQLIVLDGRRSGATGGEFSFFRRQTFTAYRAFLAAVRAAKDPTLVLAPGIPPCGAVLESTRAVVVRMPTVAMLDDYLNRAKRTPVDHLAGCLDHLAALVKARGSDADEQVLALARQYLARIRVEGHPGQDETPPAHAPRNSFR